ncbi:ArsC family reductase [Uliginosibacterium sp. 31-16]|uniref:ArsC family reductase n=1 Tax=Uliginosibacterium sp. 31-16 TaxID=3068315 RepID=UPI00273F17C0|nr:ArsC family reductase [Uliginosibacterium sp. 31-16]MDP5239768.1 ArsC family reductase [Uliginosibacterium sp. 31-16]
MIKIFGIKQCSTMAKAFAWLDAQHLPYEFHDYKKLGIDAGTLAVWCADLGWEALVNTRGTTWRKLPEADRSNLDQARAIRLMVANPSLIKRPLILGGNEPLLGFDAARYAQVLGARNV